MTFDLTKFKKINDRHKLTVSGYINNIQCLFPSDNCFYQIHDLIKQICTIFYASIHEWDLQFIGSKVKYIADTNSIKQQASGSSSSFLTEEFNSGMHDWRFKIDKCRVISHWSSTIGIWKTKSNACFRIGKS